MKRFSVLELARLRAWGRKRSKPKPSNGTAAVHNYLERRVLRKSRWGTYIAATHGIAAMGSLEPLGPPPHRPASRALGWCGVDPGPGMDVRSWLGLGSIWGPSGVRGYPSTWVVWDAHVLGAPPPRPTELLSRARCRRDAVPPPRSDLSSQRRRPARLRLLRCICSLAS